MRGRELVGRAVQSSALSRLKNGIICFYFLRGAVANVFLCSSRFFFFTSSPALFEPIALNAGHHVSSIVQTVDPTLCGVNNIFRCAVKRSSPRLCLLFSCCACMYSACDGARSLLCQRPIVTVC